MVPARAARTRFRESCIQAPAKRAGRVQMRRARESGLAEASPITGTGLDGLICWDREYSGEPVHASTGVESETGCR